jgi:hypothetical protein
VAAENESAYSAISRLGQWAARESATQVTLTYIALGIPLGADPPHSTSGTTTKDLAVEAPSRQPERQPSFQARPDLGELTVTASTNQLVDPDTALPTSSLPSRARRSHDRHNQVRRHSDRWRLTPSQRSRTRLNASSAVS